MEQEINGKVQKINDEDYEIIQVIESKSRVDAIKWYQENYSSSVEDAISAISAIYKQYKGGYKPDGTEVMLLLDEYQKKEKDMIKSEDKVMEVLMHLTGCNKSKAQEYINEAYGSQTEQKDSTDGGGRKGCMITIVIAITSTLSLFCLL